MTETLADRALEWAYALEKNGRPGLAELLRLLVSENTTLATERNAALAAVTTAEQRAANAEAALETMTAEVAARIAEAVAQEREACALLLTPQNDPSDWTEYAHIHAEAAAAIRARKDSTP